MSRGGGVSRSACGLVLLLAALAPLLALPVRAAAEVAIEAEMFVVGRDAEDNETLAPPAGGSVAPGVVLEYRFSYSNTGAPVSAVVLNGPIPEWTRYVGGSARAEPPARFEVQLAGEDEWEPPPILRRRVRDDGSEVVETVPPSEYGALRWVLEGSLPTGATGTFGYRIRIEE